jgi:hypothetical protein
VQSGKTTIIAAEAISYLPWSDEFWFCGPDFRQSRKELLQIIEWTKVLGIFDPSNASLPRSDAPWSFRLTTGQLFQSFSGVNARKMAGSSPGFVAIVEAGQCPQDVYQTANVRARLKDAPFFVSGTLEDAEGWYVALCEQWETGSVAEAMAWSLPTWTNLVLFPQGRSDPKIKAMEDDPTMSRETFQMRVAGIAVPPPGIVFGPTEYHPGFDPLLHVRPIQFGPQPEIDEWAIMLSKDSEVEVGIDPGWDHPYAVVAGVWEPETRSLFVIDEVVLRGVHAPQMIEVCRGRWWWPRVRVGAMDIAGTQHGGAPLTNYDYWTRPPPIGAGLALYAEERVKVSEGTAKIRGLLQPSPALKRPRLIISDRCKHLAWELRTGYRNLTNRQGQVVGGPVARNDDATKAMIYLVNKLVRGLPEDDRPRAPRCGIKSESLPWERVAS